MNRLKTAFLCICLLPTLSAGADNEFDKYEGLAAQELADAVRRDFLPSTPFPSSLPVGGFFPADWPGSWMPEAWPGDGSRVGLIVPEGWTRAPLYDLYNMVGSDDSFEIARSLFPPGELVDTVQSGTGWQSGLIEIGNEVTNGWQPALDRRGDVARRFLYVALMYPQKLWEDRAVLIMADGSWPLLTTYGRRLLGKWIADDPVDAREINESEEIAAIQGNSNPFIRFPRLFDYLWGENSDQGYVPDDKVELTPLKASYSIKSDGYIDFYSPYAGDGASWEFDGSPVDGQRMSLASVSAGRHTVSFVKGTLRGKIIIRVVP